MDKLSLKVKTRTAKDGRPKNIRQANSIPAVLYGHGTENRNLIVSYLEFEKVFREAGENTLVELEVEGSGKSNVLIHEVQNDPLSGKISHIDFFQIRMDEKIETEIPLEFTGEAPAVKALGGILVKSLDGIEVSCLPADLPHSIPVDVSVIDNFDIHIKIKDLSIPNRVKVLDDPESVVALVTPPRSDEELAKLNEKVEEDVTKVEGVVKPARPGETAPETEVKKE